MRVDDWRWAVNESKSALGMAEALAGLAVEAILKTGLVKSFSLEWRRGVEAGEEEES